MNPIVFALALLMIGLATGWIVGAGLSFTGGRRRLDLVAGLSGALLAGLSLRWLAPPGYREALPSLIIGATAAMLATFLTRILTAKPEPVLRRPADAWKVGRAQLSHDVMTTAEGTKLLLNGGKLSVPERNAGARRPGQYAE